MSAPVIRVLVVDDSATVRGALIDALDAAPGFEVVGDASDGDQAFRLCDRLRPDVVTLDMAMPTCSGLEATRRIMARCPTPILIVSASANRRDALRTYDALLAGAVDVHDKSQAAGPDGRWQAEFLARVQMVAGVSVVGRRHRVPLDRMRSSAARPRADGASLGASRGSGPSRRAIRRPAAAPVPRPAPPPLGRRLGARMAPALIAIGASTGGPAAVTRLLGALPAPTPVPIALVQHVSPQFADSFRTWLDQQIPHRVVQISRSTPLSEVIGAVCLPPPDHHLVVRSGVLRPEHGPELHSCRPSVDALFMSLAIMAPAVVAVLLTGMGRDGAEGMRAIVDAGGTTIAQDAATSVIHGMPGAAIALGAARHILPLDEIAPTLQRRLSQRADLVGGRS